MNATLLDPSPQLTPSQFVALERELLKEAREALQNTRLVRFFPNSEWVICVNDARIDVRIKRQEFILKE